jgi:hypothetical protein
MRMEVFSKRVTFGAGETRDCNGNSFSASSRKAFPRKFSSRGCKPWVIIEVARACRAEPPGVQSEKDLVLRSGMQDAG